MAITDTTIRPPEQSPQDDPRSVTGDVEGRFVFSGLDPGVYVMAAGHEGYRLTPYNPYNPWSGGTIELQPGGASGGLIIRISPQGAIGGHVRGEDGSPVSGAQVLAVLGWGRRLAVQGSAVTDSRGEYRIRGLDSETYYLRVIPPAARASAGGESTSYLPVFYPAGQSVAEASAVHVAEGREYAIDVRLPPGRPPFIRGTIAGPPEVTALSVEATSMEFGGLAGTVGQFQGGRATFEIDRLSAGPHLLHAAGIQAGQTLEAWMPVRVDPDGLTGVELSLAPAADIAGKVEMRGAPGENPSRLRFDLRTTYSDRPDIPFSVHADGTFLVKNLPPDVYRIMPRHTGAVYLEAVHLRGLDATESGIDLTDVVPSGELVLVLNAASGSIRGRVLDEKGEAFRGALITLSPADGSPDSQRARWAEQTTAPDLSGRYGFDGIRPGTYKLLAWKPEAGARIHDPDFLKQFESRIRFVHVAPKCCESVDLNAIP